MTTSQIQPHTVALPVPGAARPRGLRAAHKALLLGAAVVALVVLLVASLTRGGGLGGATSGSGALLTHTVEPVKLRLTVLESGTLESASSVKVLSRVQDKVAIIALVPEATAVKAGDVVVELDSSLLKTRLREQQILVEKARAAFSQADQAYTVAVSQAESDVQRAELALESAELDRKTFVEIEYPQQVRLLQAEVTLAEEEFNLAKVQLGYSEELAREKYLSEEEIKVERLRVRRAELTLENARSNEQKLRESTYPRTLRNLDTTAEEARRALDRTRKLAGAAVEHAATNRTAEESTLRLEEGKLRHVEEQIEHCLMRAPQDGVVVYPVPEDDDLVELFIREGTIIRERQHVFSIPDTDQLQVATSVHEAMVNRVRAGMPARIWIDVYPDLVLAGDVAYVSPLADPEDWRRTTAKFYPTTVALSEQRSGLRPGMSAKVEILIDQRPGVLALPVQSVFQKGRLGACYVLEGGGPKLRRVELGEASDQFIEVRAGLAAGERVVLSPDVLGVPAQLLEDLEREQEAPALAAQSSVPAPPPEQAAAPVEVECKAVLLGAGDAVAEAELEVATQGDQIIKKELDLKVNGGPPGSVWEVRVDGSLVGTVELDENGAAETEWSTKDGTLPEEFPASAGDGSTVTVGPLSGTLAR